uniref:Uncharacterized protein n=1 Tax=Trichuris muris TaxID=70415 RepID=A0A5S6QTN5_TRIMR
MIGEKEKLLSHEDWPQSTPSSSANSVLSSSLQDGLRSVPTVQNGGLTCRSNESVDASTVPSSTIVLEDALPMFPKEGNSKRTSAGPDFHAAQMTKEDLLRLAHDFKSGKLAIFKTDDGLASMRAIRRKQEKLMNLHLALAQEEMAKGVWEEAPRKKIQENSKLLMDEFAELVDMIDEFNSRRRNSEAGRQLGLDDIVQPVPDQAPDDISFA